MSMSQFTEPDRRRRKRKGRNMQDPASMTLEERFGRLQRTIETRRTQWYEDPSTKAEWLEQLGQAKAVMIGASNHSEAYQSCLELTGNGLNFAQLNLSHEHHQPVHIVCLGIGKISESRESQYQFLQLQHLATFFETTDVWLYDPLFEPIDIMLIEANGYRVLAENRLGCYRLPDNRPAFAYLPHCPRGLYEAFIRENWTQNALGWRVAHKDNVPNGPSGRHVIIANDFKDYALSLPASRFKAESPFLAKAADVLNLTPLPGLKRNHPALPAFSSLVWMHLPQAETTLPKELERLLEREEAENLDISLGEMVISDIGESVRLQSDLIDDAENC